MSIVYPSEAMNMMCGRIRTNLGMYKECVTWFGGGLPDVISFSGNRSGWLFDIHEPITDVKVDEQIMLYKLTKRLMA